MSSWECFERGKNYPTSIASWHERGEEKWFKFRSKCRQSERCIVKFVFNANLTALQSQNEFLSTPARISRSSFVRKLLEMTETWSRIEFGIISIAFVTSDFTIFMTRRCFPDINKLQRVAQHGMDGSKVSESFLTSFPSSMASFSPQTCQLAFSSIFAKGNRQEASKCPGRRNASSET